MDNQVIDRNSINELIESKFTDNFDNLKNQRLKYFLKWNLDSCRGEIYDLNWLKDNQNLIQPEITTNELNLIYENIDKINNTFLQAKLYDYFWCNKMNTKNIFKDFEKAKKLYLKELKKLIEEKNENFDRFYTSLQRYIVLSCIPENKKPKDIHKCYNDIKNIYKGIISKKLNKLLKYFIRILSNNNYRNFSHYFFEKENIANKEVLNCYFNLLKKPLKNENDKKNLNFTLLEIKKIIDNIRPFFLETDIKVYKKLLLIINKIIFKNYIEIANIDNSDPRLESFWIRDAILFAENNKIVNQKILNNYKIRLDKVKKNIKYYPIYINNNDLNNIMNKEYQNTINYIKCNNNFWQKIQYMILLTYNFLKGKNEFLAEVEKYKTFPFPTLNIDINGNIKSIDDGKFSNIQTIFIGWCDILDYCYINPILENIKQNYFFNEDCFVELIENNNFIPEDHKLFYIKGLYYFFERKLIESFHILIPQIENSLRYIIKKFYSTTIQKQNHTELEEINISDLIEKAKNINLINEKICFYLELLFDKDYCNIRNNLAHGFDLQDIYSLSRYNVLGCLVLYIIFDFKGLIQK